MPVQKNEGSKKVRVAGIGAWHTHAKDFSARVMEDPGAVMYAVWDEDSDVGRQWALECGGSCRYEPSLDRLFADPNIDAVLITCATARHFEMIMRAARAGKHIYVEKPAFTTAQEADEAEKLIRKTGICFMVGSPIVKPMHLKAKKLLEEGRLGVLTHIRYRTVHELGWLGTQRDTFYRKDENGGGVMMDMGNHALHLLQWFLGVPRQIEAVYTSVMPKAAENGVDDHDTAALLFENGVTGTIETDWVTPWYQYGFDLYGTKGCVSCRAYEMFVCLEEEGWSWRKIGKEELTEGYPYPLSYWLSCIREGRPVEWDGIGMAKEVTLMSDMTVRAALQPFQPVVRNRGEIGCRAKEQDLYEESRELPALWQKAMEMTRSGIIKEVMNVRIHLGISRIASSEDPAAESDSLSESCLLSAAEAFLGRKLTGIKRITGSSSRVILGRHEDDRLSVIELTGEGCGEQDSLDVCGTNGWIRIRGDRLSYTTTPAGDRNAVWAGNEV